MQTQDIHTSHRSIVETAQVGAVRYQLERVRCGKTVCRRCSDGVGHGPYWYGYRRCDGGVKRTYYGRDLPPDVAQARREATRAKRESQALVHEIIEDVYDALLSLGGCLLDAEESGIRDLDPDLLTADEISQLEDQGYQLEEAASALADVMRDALRRVRQRIMCDRELIEEAEYLLEESADENELEAINDLHE